MKSTWTPTYFPFSSVFLLHRIESDYWTEMTPNVLQLETGELNVTKHVNECQVGAQTLEMSVLKLHHVKFWLCWIKTRRVGFNVFVMVWEHWRFSAQTWFQNKFVFQNKIFFQTMNLNYKFTIYINLIALNHPKIFKYVL